MRLGPGKYSTNVDEFVDGLGTEAELSADEGWVDHYGLLHFTEEDRLTFWANCAEDDEDRDCLDGKVGAIVHTDNLGFVDVELFDDEEELLLAWEEIEQSFAEEEEDEEEDDELDSD